MIAFPFGNLCIFVLRLRCAAMDLIDLFHQIHLPSLESGRGQSILMPAYVPTSVKSHQNFKIQVESLESSAI